MCYSMNIVDYSILFLGDLNVDLLVFLKIFLVMRVMIWLRIWWFSFIFHTHVIHLIFGDNGILYPLWWVNTTWFWDNSIIFNFNILKLELSFFNYFLVFYPSFENNSSNASHVAFHLVSLSILFHISSFTIKMITCPKRSLTKFYYHPQPFPRIDFIFIFISTKVSYFH